MWLISAFIINLKRLDLNFLCYMWMTFYYQVMICIFSWDQKFSQKILMKDLGDVSFVKGIQIQCDRTRGIFGLSQKAYIDKVLDRCGMKNCSRISWIYSNVPKMTYRKSKWKIFHMHRRLEIWCMLKFVPIQT